MSKRQAEILEFIQRSIDAQQFAPTYDEIAIHLGYKSLATVKEHLDNLEEKGWIRRASMRRARSSCCIGCLTSHPARANDVRPLLVPPSLRCAWASTRFGTPSPRGFPL
ncbi:MAG: LexA family protein [Gemmatimonadaceae bacterium]